MHRSDSTTGKTHHLSPQAIHHRWNRAIPAALEIEPGETVVFETPEITRGQITPKTTSPEIAALDFDPIHQISGPVAVRGAQPGDTLVVEIVDIVPKPWGWTAVIPGFGLLAEDEVFQTPYVHHWDLSNGKSAQFKPGIVIPFEPFCGILGVAPATDEELSTIPPRFNGGNLDIRQTVKGSTVYMPVQTAGALFSLGDVHGAQGDGEVCGSAIECQATVTVRLSLMKGHAMPELAFRMPGAMTGSWNTAGWMGVTAHGPDLFAASQQAIRYMIDYLGRSHKLTPAEAYVLCSACVDLKISEIVDAPNWIVTAALPLGIFENSR
jgi:acetamidase/formamidase